MDNKDESFEHLLQEHETKSKKLEIGQKISGKIIALTDDDAFIDIGDKQDGVLDRKELVSINGEDNASIGANVEAFVIGVSSQGVRLSRSMSGSGIAAIEEAMNSRIPVDGRVASICKGGYQVEVLGKIAFCPGSQMEIAASGNNEDLIGKQMQFLIMRIENHGRNIVVSRRAILDSQREESLAKLLDNIKAGDIIEGKVKRLAQFGAFIELAPGVEGMAHLSELSWSHINSPADILNIDDLVSVKVLSIDKDEKGRVRIALSKKQADGDPWLSVGEKFKIGDIVEGTVRRLAPFGAFIEIYPGIEGLVHVSELAWGKRVNKPEDVVKAGDSVRVKIREMDPEAKRISLSMRDAQGDPWEDAVEKFAPGMKVDGVVESKSTHGIFVKLADGITGLLPMSAIKNAPKSSDLSKLNSGDHISLQIQNLDTAARRISLMLINNENAAHDEDKSWKAHTATENANESNGIMAQALKNAFQKKKGGSKA